MLADVMRNPKFGYVFSFLLGVGLMVIVMHRECKDGSCKKSKAPVPGEVTDTVYMIESDCYKFKTKQVHCPSEGEVIESFKQNFRKRPVAAAE
jgi:hypothetical protein